MDEETGSYQGDEFVPNISALGMGKLNSVHPYRKLIISCLEDPGIQMTLVWIMAVLAQGHLLKSYP